MQHLPSEIICEIKKYLTTQDCLDFDISLFPCVKKLRNRIVIIEDFKENYCLRCHNLKSYLKSCICKNLPNITNVFENNISFNMQLNFRWIQFGKLFRANDFIKNNQSRYNDLEYAVLKLKVFLKKNKRTYLCLKDVMKLTKLSRKLILENSNYSRISRKRYKHGRIRIPIRSFYKKLYKYITFNEGNVKT